MKIGINPVTELNLLEWWPTLTHFFFYPGEHPGSLSCNLAIKWRNWISFTRVTLISNQIERTIEQEKDLLWICVTDFLKQTLNEWNWLFQIFKKVRRKAKCTPVFFFFLTDRNSISKRYFQAICYKIAFIVFLWM